MLELGQHDDVAGLGFLGLGRLLAVDVEDGADLFLFVLGGVVDFHAGLEHAAIDADEGSYNFV